MRQDALRRDSSARPRDAVDAIVSQWRTERPDLDPTAKGITGRVVRLASIFQQSFGEAFAPLGINEGDYGVLAALRRAGAPFELTPTELARQRMMTSGGMTAALDRLERKGLLERAPNPNDRRGSLVRLTASGRATVDVAMERHAEVERELVASLSAGERERLTDLLRTLLVAVDGERG